MLNCGPNTPLMVALLMTSCVVTSRVDRLAIGLHHAACRRRSIGLAALLDEHHAHAPTDVGAASSSSISLAAARVELDGDGRAFLRGGAARVGEVVAGHDDVALQQDRRWPLPRIGVELGAERRTAAGLGLERVVLHVRQAPFERRDLAEDVLHLSGVLHAGELHVDAIRCPAAARSARTTPSSFTRLRMVSMFLVIA